MVPGASQADDPTERKARRVERWNELQEVPAGYGPSIVTLGNFDGVHAGHRAVLGEVVTRARAVGGRAVAITFDPHPLQVLHPDRAPALITSLRQRLELMASTGLDAVLVMEFTRELATWSPREFVERVLVATLGARTVVVGRDTRFGHRNSGDVGTLQALGAELGFAVEVLGDRHPESADRRWSSSWVRELLLGGDVADAAAVLARPHRLAGTVVHGDHRGRELGFPTANLGEPVEGLVPADGVYAGWMLRRTLPDSDPDRMLPAAVSIGTNPTFDGESRRVEAYVLDRTDLDLYGEPVALELVERLRPTERFDSVEALVAQMRDDVEACRRVLGHLVVPGHEQAAGLGADDGDTSRG
ncbi:MAG TPA: bifunctional riboflavin kinase/FAD synthetase [Actinomycetales bacterium]|nr:bifunctional riboflavin kinase/FAD synthetase [Actinomycetales bacterium]